MRRTLLQYYTLRFSVHFAFSVNRAFFTSQAIKRPLRLKSIILRECYIYPKKEDYRRYADDIQKRNDPPERF